MTPSFMVPPICSETFGDLACNRLTSALEISRLHDDPPDHVFTYPSGEPSESWRTTDSGAHTTWMGDRIGACHMGPEYRSGFGDKRRSVRLWIGTTEYTGTLYGTYIRARKVRRAMGGGQ